MYNVEFKQPSMKKNYLKSAEHKVLILQNSLSDLVAKLTAPCIKRNKFSNGNCEVI